MKSKNVKFALMLSFFFGSCISLNAQFVYPITRVVDSSDTYFGKTYHDPYRWLENIKSPEVASWFKQQASFTSSWLDKLNGRDELIAEWKMLDKIKPVQIRDLIVKNGRYFYRKTMPGESVGKLYFRNGINGEEILLFDPLSFIPGKILSLQEFLPSYDGKKLALSYSMSGAEVGTIRFMNVDTRSMLTGLIFPTRGLNSWTFDNKSFLYMKLNNDDPKDPKAFLNSQTRIHLLSGTPASSDIDYFSSISYPELKIEPGAYPSASFDEFAPAYVFGTVGTVEPELTMFYAPTNKLDRKLAWKSLCRLSDSIVQNIEFAGDRIFAISHDHAPNFKLVSTSLQHPDWKNAQIVVAEKSDMHITSMVHSKNFLFLTYSDGVNSHVLKYAVKTGLVSPVSVPLTGTMVVQAVDQKSDYTLIRITSWNKPVTEFVYDPINDRFTPSPFNKLESYPEKYMDLEAKEVEVKAADGTLIPLSIIFKKGMKLDGQNTCVLDGYGAYGYSHEPSFVIFLNALVVKGAIYAVAHVRGGGEKGQRWYKAGYKTTKSNTWKDFNACAQYLVDQKYTSPSHLAGMGTSAGGILISRAITERPDLYAAALCNVGCANAMRLEFSANGPVNIPEFGTVKDSIECQALYEMDGMQHVVKGVKYPAVMSIGGWNDPRVVPWEPAKFAAAVQGASTSGKPVFIKINYDNGHFTEDKNVVFANFGDQLSFAMWQCGHPGFQLKKQTP